MNVRDIFESAKTVIERPEMLNELSNHGGIVGGQEGKFAELAMRVLHVQRLFPITHNEDPFLKKYSNIHNKVEDCKEEVVKKSASTANVETEDVNEQKKSGFINIDPNGNWYIRWLFIVSFGVGYNYWTLILRVAFIEGMGRHYRSLFVLDYIIDMIFLLDIYVQSRTGYMENGELVIEVLKTRYHYIKTFGFWLDCLSVIPLDLLYLIFGVNPIFRLARLLKLHRFLSFYERVQTITNRPNLFNLTMMLHHVFLIIHWVSCAYFLVSKNMGYGSEPWVYPVLEGEWNEVRAS